MTYVALLRGVNLGGHKMVPMAQFRGALADCGYTNVRTLLQSGNVVFEGRAAKPSSIETRLERELVERFDVAADVHVRTAAEWPAIVAANPFSVEADRMPSHLLVGFYRAPLDPAKVAAFQKSIAGPERVRCDGRHLYMTFPDGVGNSKATVNMDRMLGVRGTARNWNTVRRLAALAAEGGK